MVFLCIVIWSCLFKKKRVTTVHWVVNLFYCLYFHCIRNHVVRKINRVILVHYYLELQLWPIKQLGFTQQSVMASPPVNRSINVQNMHEINIQVAKKINVTQDGAMHILHNISDLGRNWIFSFSSLWEAKAIKHSKSLTPTSLCLVPLPSPSRGGKVCIAPLVTLGPCLSPRHGLT